MYVQDIALPTGINRKKKWTDGTQEYSSQSSVKSSHSDGRQVCVDEDQIKEMSG